MNDQLFDFLDAWYTGGCQDQPPAVDAFVRMHPELQRDLEHYQAVLRETAWLDGPIDDTSSQREARQAMHPAEPSIGPYQLLDRLGRGGMGEVYRARHTLMDRDVAVKLLLPARYSKEIDRERFLREMRMLGKLQHPNVVAAYDALETDGNLVLVTEFVDGRDLSSIVRERGRLDPAEVVDIGCQAAAGLAHAHKAGIVHRDIKPSNLMLRTDGVVKILDLGIARLMDARELSDSSLTGSRFTLGTPEYLPPEQFLDARGVDQRADVYSLGAALYCLVTGSPPYGSGSCGEVIIRHREAAIPHATASVPELPLAWDTFFAKALAKDPTQRFADMHELQVALTQVPQVLHRRVASRISRRQAIAWGVGGALAASVVAGVWGILRGPTTHAIIQFSPPDVASRVVVRSQDGDEIGARLRLLERDNQNGIVRVALPLDHGDHHVRFEHPGFPAAQVMIPRGLVAMEPTTSLQVHLEHSGCAYWKLHPGENGCQLEFAAPGFDGWYLDIAGGDVKNTWSRCCVLCNVFSTAQFWQLDGQVGKSRVSSLNRDYRFATPVLGQQIRGADDIPVILERMMPDRNDWMLREAPNGQVTIESIYFPGHFLTCANPRPLLAQKGNDWRLNPVVVRRLKFV